VCKINLQIIHDDKKVSVVYEAKVILIQNF